MVIQFARTHTNILSLKVTGFCCDMIYSTSMLTLSHYPQPEVAKTSSTASCHGPIALENHAAQLRWKNVSHQSYTMNRRQ